MEKLEFTYEHLDPADKNWIGPTRIFSSNTSSVIRAVRRRTGKQAPKVRIWHDGMVIARLIKGSQTLHRF